MYINHCWFPGCHTKINSNYSKRCPICGWYICPSCGSCKQTCPHIDLEGYDRDGFDKNGFDREGFDREGFDKKHIHRNGTMYNDEGFNISGYDKDGYDRMGKDMEGYNRQGFNTKGFNRIGLHKNGTYFDDDGFNIDGLDEIDLLCRDYTVGSTVMVNNYVGRIVKYEPQKAQPIIKIKFKDGILKSYGLKTLLTKGLIKLI